MSAHISGPWDVAPPCCVVAVLDNRAVVDIATVNPLGELNAATAEANARLISAAPDLLEALQNAVAAGLPEPVAEAARAAIAKATAPAISKSEETR